MLRHFLFGKSLIQRYLPFLIDFVLLDTLLCIDMGNEILSYRF